MSADEQVSFGVLGNVASLGRHWLGHGADDFGHALILGGGIRVPG